MKNTETLLVTGASGHLGQLVLEALLKGPKRNIIATTRNPEKLAHFKDRGVDVRQADFGDVASLEKAFAGADRLLLISTDAVGARVKQHKDAIAAAKKVGVKHILYTSYPNTDKAPAAVAPDHFETEKLILASGLGYTILRNNLYMENLISPLNAAVKHNAYIGTTGEGKTAYVTRQDCADAAAGALASDQSGNKIVDVTGPQALSNAEIAQALSELAGKKIQAVDMPAEEYAQVLVKAGLPGFVADMFVSFDLTARQGLAAHVSTAVKDFSGHAPKTFAEFLRDHAQEIKG